MSGPRYGHTPFTRLFEACMNEAGWTVAWSKSEWEQWDEATQRAYHHAAYKAARLACDGTFGPGEGTTPW